MVKIVPNDRDARKKLEECEKTVRRLAFEESIAAEHIDAFAAMKIDDIGITEGVMSERIANKFVILSKNVISAIQ